MVGPFLLAFRFDAPPALFSLQQKDPVSVKQLAFFERVMVES